MLRSSPLAMYNSDVKDQQFCRSPHRLTVYCLMKILSRQSLSRKLIWCCDLICHKCITIFTRKHNNSEKVEDEEKDHTKGVGEEAGGKKQNESGKEENEEEDLAEGVGAERGGKKQNKSKNEEDEEEDHAEGVATEKKVVGKMQNKSEKEDDEDGDHTGGAVGEEAGGTKQIKFEKEKDEGEDHTEGAAEGKKQIKFEKDEEEDHAEGEVGEESGGEKQNQSGKEENEEVHAEKGRGATEEEVGGKKQNKSEKEEDNAKGGGGRAREEAGGKGKMFKELPDDVMQLILHRLSLLDYLNCRDVSHCWRAAVDSKRWLPAARQLPWLLHRPALPFNYQTYYIKTENDYFFASGRKLCKSEDYTSYHWSCAGSIEGWLILVNSTADDANVKTVNFFFLNPVSGARVMLPSHPVPTSNYFPRVKIAASSEPTKMRSCYVTCLNFEEKGRLALCTPTDKSWTFIEDEKALEFWDIEIVDGKLYAVGSHLEEFLVVFDIHLDLHDSRLHTYTSERMVTLQPNIRSFFCRRLAICSESKDIFMIVYQWRPEIFEVWKLDYNISTGSPQWVDVVELGDRALFIGGVNNIFITCHDKTLERNNIYFALDSWGEKYDSGVFSLTNRTIKPLPFPKNHQYGYRDDTFWFTPTPW